MTANQNGTVLDSLRDHIIKYAEMDYPRAESNNHNQKELKWIILENC